ncbi:hypothetical protein VOLCADRAFT_91768 [Volvox carteri f. nagariensis]|uniref:Uncharacterized protein n=1 Tax=Volvox carteri f. nagariensis TaxID=3068 RepID=D8TXX1_VOLCA|nr:uncharacterized protein VOLCADRAFT_91768 [Volvox carteri f. nagariensis]EFJ47794.1 hypothetical protein VOLCADRAFT_91768 [Volvox carteri f. nagariensis]|eukprot:XP_002951265.1 hypothetical protein VOLCADRAFT_91768 [Volvox carteri f. nagariensis]
MASGYRAAQSYWGFLSARGPSGVTGDDLFKTLVAIGIFRCPHYVVVSSEAYNKLLPPRPNLNQESRLLSRRPQTRTFVKPDLEEAYHRTRDQDRPRNELHCYPPSRRLLTLPQASAVCALTRI